MNTSNDSDYIRKYVEQTKQKASLDNNFIVVSKPPNLGEHEKYFPETFYYIADMLEERFVYLSESVESIFGIAKEAGEKMHAAQFMGQITHPEDLPAVLEISEKFFSFIETQSKEKLADIKMLRSFRLKNLKGEYKKIIDHVSVLEVNQNQRVTKFFGAISLAPMVSDFDITSAIILDTTNGKELSSFNLKNEAAQAVLTKREIQIMRLLAVGFKNREVAEKLDISILTVQTHRKHIMSKLNLSSPIDIVWKALEFNLDMRA